MTINIIAGQELYATLQAEKAANVAKSANGYDSNALCTLQRRQAGRGIVGAQIVESNYGFSVRYDSGLQEWGLLRSSRDATDPSREAAVAFCKAWVAQDPSRRYAWE